MASEGFDLAYSLAQIASGKAKYELRGALEIYLLGVLRTGGVEGVIKLLRDMHTVEIYGDPTFDSAGSVVFPALAGNSFVSISILIIN